MACSTSASVRRFPEGTKHPNERLRKKPLGEVLWGSPHRNERRWNLDGEAVLVKLMSNALTGPRLQS